MNDSFSINQPAKKAAKSATRVTARNITLTKAAFSSLMGQITKALNECASFDPTTGLPKELKERYLGLYTRCVDLYASPADTKEDKYEMVVMSYGLSIEKIDFVQGLLTLVFYRTTAGVEKKYVLNIQNECGPYAKAAIAAYPQEDSKKIQAGYMMV